MRKGVLATIALAAALLGVPNAEAAPFVYVTNVRAVSQYSAGPGGLLAPLVPPVVAVSGNHQGLAIAVSPDGRSVYVANANGFPEEDAGTVDQFDVGPDGTLRPKSPLAVPTQGDFPDGVAVHPDGRSVYVANGGSDTISQFDVDTGGRLRPKSPPTVVAGFFPEGVTVSPDGDSVYVANEGSSDVSQYDVVAGGALSPKDPPTVPSPSAVSGPTSVVITPDGESVYVPNSDQGGPPFPNPWTISQYDVEADGTLTPKNPPTVPSDPIPTRAAVHPDGKSLYVATNRGIAQYDIGPDGSLVPKDPPSVADGPIGIAVHPDGGSVYATGVLAGIGQFNVGADGTLSPKSPPSVDGGFLPFAVAVSPLTHPTSKDQCRNGGWRNFGTTFKNQGQCVSFVATGGKKQP